MRSWCVAIVISLAVVPRAASAQWVSNPKSLELQLSSEFQFSDREFHTGQTVSNLGTQSLRETLGVTYVPIEKLGIDIAATWQLDRYTGAEMTGGVPLRHGPNDNGDWNANFGDLAAAVRYVAYDGVLTVTPLIKTKIPLTDYPRQGFAATGSGLKEIGAGLELGKNGFLTDPLVLWGSYTYTFVEKETAGGADTEQYRPSYSEGSLGLAYSLDRLLFGAGATYHLTHEGFDLDDYGPLFFGDPDNGLVLWHDPVTKRDYLAITAFAQYNITDRLTGQLQFAIIPTGDNVTDAKTIALQLSWTALPGT